MAESDDLYLSGSPRQGMLSQQLQVRGLSDEGAADAMAGRLPQSGNDRLRLSNFAAEGPDSLGDTSEQDAARLQKMMDDMKQLTEMQTSILQMENESKKSIIQSIR